MSQILKLSFLLFVFLVSCEQKIEKEKPNEDQANKLHSKTKEIKKTSIQSQNEYEYNLDSLEARIPQFDQLKKLPKVNPSLLSEFIALTHDNMFAEKEYTSFHVYKEFKLEGYKAFVILRLTDLNSRSGILTLVVLDKNRKIIANSRLAEYFNEAGGFISYKSKQTKPNEFLVKYKLSFVEYDKSNAEGVSEYIGNSDIEKTEKLIFENSIFKKQLIDSAYSIEKL